MENDVAEEKSKKEASITLENLIANINSNAVKEEGSDLSDLDKTLESNDGIMDISKGEYFTDELSINVSMTELDILCDMEDGDGTEKTEPGVSKMDVGDEDDGEHSGEAMTNSVTSLEAVGSERAEPLLEPKSKLHCQLCGEVYTKPVMLDCLHTFCYTCLEKRVGGKHRFIFCAVCHFKTCIKMGLSSVPANNVFSRLIESESRSNVKQNCVVCMMHEDEKIPTHICKDCGDKLCDECAEKHTFSRVTAKHVVVCLQNCDEEDVCGTSDVKRVEYCEKHENEELRFICYDCNIAVCRDCIMLSHQSSSHKCVSQTEVHEQLSTEIQTLTDSLNSKINEFTENFEETIEEDFEFLLEMEKKQEEVLHKISEDLIDTINKKIAKGLEELHEEFEKKRRYCKTRKDFVERNKACGIKVIEKVEFLLKEGTALDLIPLKDKLYFKLKDSKKVLDKVFPRVKDLGFLPHIKPVLDNMDVMKRLTVYTLHTHKQSDKKSAIDTESKNMKKEMPGKQKVSDKNNKTKSKSSHQPEMKGVSGPTLRQPLSPLPSLGRGHFFKSSLLGEYVQPTFSPGNQQGLKNVQSKPNADGNRPARFTFHSYINTKLPTDRQDGRIMGLAFVGNMNLAVSDCVNNRLKVFSLRGSFMDMIQDAAPLSVTACNNTIIWNADYNKIKMYDGNANTYKVVRMYRKDTISHPVTSFKHEKYLVLNREFNTVEAYNLSNQLVHSMKPKDRVGRLLKNIESIAARSEDQVVLICAVYNRLFITDFDGNSIGEYFEQHWQPGCASIDHRNNIFVTDVKNCRLIMLNPRGQFRCDWPLQIQGPFCAACNGHGNVVVSGQGSVVHNFTYTY